MRLQSFALGLTAAVAIAGCSSNGTDTPATTSTCNAALTGAVTATFKCTVTDAYVTAGSTSTISITGGGSGATLSFGVTVAGSPVETILTNASHGVFGSIYITSGTASWLGTNTDAPQGGFTLSLATLTVLSSNTNGATYAASGTLDATLPAQGGTTATGSITVHIDFATTRAD